MLERSLLSTSAPPPASLSTQRNLRPWYLLVTMVCSWLIGVLSLSDSFGKLMFLRDNSVPDVNALIRDLANEPEPVQALLTLLQAAHLRALSESVRIAFPLTVGKLIVSVLLVITSAMAMSGRPGSRTVTIQAHLAYAALAAATFWLLRDARYEAIDVLQNIRPTLPTLFPSLPPPGLEVCLGLFSKTWLIWSARLSLAVFGIGALLVGALALTTNRTKAFFEAVAATAEDTEDL